MSRAPLSLAVAQPACVARDVAANALAHAALVRAARTRVVVFPEMSLTGYELDAPATSPHDPAIEPLVAACAASGTLALVGAPVADNRGRRFIATLAISGDGGRVVYRKRWLGDEETRWFTPGPDPVVLDVDGWRLGLAICKDTGVASHTADLAALGMDVYAAGVLEHAHEAHVPADRAALISADHGVWVAIASFAGATGGGYASAAGGSAIWTPDGTVAADAGPDPGALAVATLG